MNRHTRLAKCERTLTSAPAAVAPLTDAACDPNDPAQYLVAWLDMVASLPDYYWADIDQSRAEAAKQQDQLAHNPFETARESIEEAIAYHDKRVALLEAAFAVLAAGFEAALDPLIAAIRLPPSAGVLGGYLFAPPSTRVAGRDTPAAARFWQYYNTGNTWVMRDELC